MPATEQPHTNGQTTITALQDALYGTQNYTSGARYQLPRKVPLRIEPKTYFGEIAELVSRRHLMPVQLSLLTFIARACEWTQLFLHEARASPVLGKFGLFVQQMRERFWPG